MMDGIVQHSATKPLEVDISSTLRGALSAKTISLSLPFLMGAAACPTYESAFQRMNRETMCHVQTINTSTSNRSRPQSQMSGHTQTLICIRGGGINTASVPSVLPSSTRASVIRGHTQCQRQHQTRHESTAAQYPKGDLCTNKPISHRAPRRATSLPNNKGFG